PAGQSADFSSTRALASEEQLTVLLSLPKGTVADPRPILVDAPRGFAEFFETDPLRLGVALLVLLAGLGAVVASWWTGGRDRPERMTIVAEYEPPEHLPPAHLGLLGAASVRPRG